MGSFFQLRGIVFSALFAALLVVFSFFNIHLGFSPVPITMQNFIVMLAGALLGAKYGFFSMFLVVGLTTLGFPLLHGNGGLAYILGPTGGFILAYPFAALVIGWFSERMRGRGISGAAAMFMMIFLSSLLLYVSGVPWLAHASGISLEKAMILGCYPYLPGDAIKALLAALIAVPLKQAFPIHRITGAKPNPRT